MSETKNITIGRPEEWPPVNYDPEATYVTAPGLVFMALPRQVRFVRAAREHGISEVYDYGESNNHYAVGASIEGRSGTETSDETSMTLRVSPDIVVGVGEVSVITLQLAKDLETNDRVINAQLLTAQAMQDMA